jgi:hypothetical protein
MPKDLAKYITTLDDLYKKLEYALDAYACTVEPADTLESLNDTIDNLTELNDELDSQVEEQ